MVNMTLHAEKTVNILTEFIQEKVSGAGFKSVVLGLSGGIDSALVAFLAVRALKKENVHLIMMPYKTSSEHSLDDAKKVIELLGCSSELKPISTYTDAFFNEQSNLTNLRKGNVMARMRMITLYDASAMRNSLVIGTSNKTEILLGYGTLFGDTACALNPIGDLYKTQVRQLSHFLDIPKEILTKAPTADLWAGQTDEHEMGFSYETADHILYQLIELRLTKDDVIKNGFDAETVNKIFTMIFKSDFKRKLPAIAKISNYTFGIDFKLPVT